MIKLVLLSCLVGLALSTMAIVSGITSVQQVLLLALVVLFFAVLVKAAIEGTSSGTVRLRREDRVPWP